MHLSAEELTKLKDGAVPNTIASTLSDKSTNVPKHYLTPVPFSCSTSHYI